MTATPESRAPDLKRPFPGAVRGEWARLALRAVGAVGAAVLLAVAAPVPAFAQTGDAAAREIVRHVDDLLRGESSHGRVTMEVVTERWARSMEMEMWSLGQDHSLVRESRLVDDYEVGVSYDDRGELARTMTFSNFRTLDGRLVPTELSMHPEDKPGERTTLLYAELEFNTGLDTSFFSFQRLRNGH